MPERLSPPSGAKWKYRDDTSSFTFDAGKDPTTQVATIWTKSIKGDRRVTTRQETHPSQDLERTTIEDGEEYALHYVLQGRHSRNLHYSNQPWKFDLTLNLMADRLPDFINITSSQFLYDSTGSLQVARFTFQPSDARQDPAYRVTLTPNPEHYDFSAAIGKANKPPAKFNYGEIAQISDMKYCLVKHVHDYVIIVRSKFNQSEQLILVTPQQVPSETLSALIASDSPNDWGAVFKTIGTRAKAVVIS